MGNRNAAGSHKGGKTKAARIKRNMKRLSKYYHQKPKKSLYGNKMHYLNPKTGRMSK